MVIFTHANLNITKNSLNTIIYERFSTFLSTANGEEVFVFVKASFSFPFSSVLNYVSLMHIMCFQRVDNFFLLKVFHFPSKKVFLKQFFIMNFFI